MPGPNIDRTNILSTLFCNRQRDSIRPVARRLVDSWFPGAGRFYRYCRDRQREGRVDSSAPIETPFGFKLAGNKAMATGGFEIQETVVFLQQLEGASACIDVGANIGLYSCLAASRGKPVVAIEPSPKNLSLLYENLIRNEFLDVEVFPLGLSSRPGIKRLFGGGVMASFLPGWARSSEHRYQTVAVSTLDVVINRRFEGCQLLIKLDVEGFESEVLKGAQQALALHPKPTWLVEIHPKHWGTTNKNFYETFEMFWRYGYQARIADFKQQLVQPEDVRRWAKTGFVDFGSYNYLFLSGC